MTPDVQAIAAQKLLDQKVRETITKCGIAGLGAVLVSNAGDRTIHSAQGTRKLGASGAAAQIQPQDRWCLGSVSKPVTGTTIGILIQKGIGNLTWTTKLKEVFPEIVTELGAWPQYQEVTLEQFMAHTSGMGWNASTEPNAGAPGGGWFPSPEALGLNDQNVIERRRRFVQASVLDEPLFAAGKGEQYGGGTIIVASMFETRTGIRFEQLVRKHVYTPLGMSESGWGVTSPGTLDGPWHHRWDGASLALLPDAATHTAPYNFNSHGVAGNLTISTADMGRFIKENLRPDPQILTLATRDSIQSHLPAPDVSTGTRGAWICTDPAHAATADLWHNGDDGTSYADAGLHRSARWGSAAFSNVSHVMGAAAVNDLQAAMKSMMGNWNALFATSSGPFWECVHPGPGLTRAPAGHQVFTRKHTGAMVRRNAPLSGGPKAPVEFPGGVFTSGVAAAASADGHRLQVVARGADNRIWRASSADAGMSWSGFEPILSGTFTTGPAVAISSTGAVVYVVAIGEDSLMYMTRSVSDGPWDPWKVIGAGTFTSQPATACSEDGATVHVFGRGRDYRIWRNTTSTGGASWEPHWQPIGETVFTTGPAAACDKGATTVHVTVRGTDQALWRNVCVDNGGAWLPQWQRIPDGTFTSHPAMTLASDGLTLDVVALGGDFCPYSNRSTDAGTTWSHWKQVGSEYYL
jgi:CubicO group peptidase (beta-lactamase class C family)